MLRHFFTIIWNNCRANLSLIGGMFVISLTLWYAVDYMYCVWANQNKTLGFDWSHVYRINIGILTEESYQYMSDPEHVKKAGTDWLVFLDRLKQHPDVEAVCVTHMHKHYEWINSSTTLRADTLSTGVMLRWVTPDYFRVFRVNGADGATPEQLANKANGTDMMVTENVAETLFPYEKAVGKTIYYEYEEDSVRISGVVENQKYNEYINHRLAAYSFWNEQDLANVRIQNIPWMGVYLRVRPDADKKGFMSTFRKEMRTSLRIGNLFLENMRPMSEIREVHLKDPRNELYTYITVIVFVLLNVFLAVLGTFWTRTQQRRPELALRLALGSSKQKISWMLQLEGVFLLTIAYLPVVIVAWNMAVADLISTWPVEFTVGRLVSGLLIAYLLLVLVMWISIGYPAYQAMKIEPAEVLHSE